MASVKLSPKYQVVIPRDVREQIHLKPGQQFEVFTDNGQIMLVPVRPIRQMRGFLKGINTDVEREKKDRL